MISPAMKNNRLSFEPNTVRFIFSRRCSNKGKRFSCFDVLFDAIDSSFENCLSCFLANASCSFLFILLHLPLDLWIAVSIYSVVMHNIALLQNPNLICFVSRFWIYVPFDRSTENKPIEMRMLFFASELLFERWSRNKTINRQWNHNGDFYKSFFK